MNSKNESKFKEKLPSFFVLGVQKAGTTSLHDWLNQQPDVCLPPIKETHFYSDDEKYARGINWYVNQFGVCADHAVVGEIAPEYIYSLNAPKRIHEWAPTAKLILIVRHPIERAFSNYQMEVRMGYENLSFYQALLEESKRLAKTDNVNRAHFSYIARGRYSEQIYKYEQLFPATNILLIKFEDLIDDGDKGFTTYKNICEFIGLLSSSKLADRSKLGNPASSPKSRILNNLLHRESGVKKILGKLIPNQDFKEKFAHKLDVLNQRAVGRQSVGKVPELIIEQTREEIHLLQHKFGLELSDWIKRTDDIDS